MLIISFGLWGIGDMLRTGGHSDEVAHVGGTHIPVYGWVGGTSVTDRGGARPLQPPARRASSGRPASGRSPSRRCAMACIARPRGGPAARGARQCDREVRPGRRRPARCRAAIAHNPAFQGTGGLRPQQYPAAACRTRASASLQYVAEMRRQIAATSCSAAIRAEGLAPKSLRDDIFKMERREAGRRDDLRARRDRHRRAEADRRAAQRLLRGQQGQVPDPRVPCLLLRAADSRRREGPGHRSRPIRSSRSTTHAPPSSARPRSATSTRRWPTREDRPRRSSTLVKRRQIAGGRRQGSDWARPTA